LRILQFPAAKKVLFFVKSICISANESYILSGVVSKRSFPAPLRRRKPGKGGRSEADLNHGGTSSFGVPCEWGKRGTKLVFPPPKRPVRQEEDFSFSVGFQGIDESFPEVEALFSEAETPFGCEYPWKKAVDKLSKG